MSNLSDESSEARSSEGAVLRPRDDAGAITLWLFACCAMVIAMMLIGAITRLTESGLSMVEWRPLIGALPPLSDMEWRRIFDLYRQSSEYRLENAGMTLTEFKTIFWWEYIHRVWGRLIGVVFAVPFLWFLIRGAVRGRLALRLFGLFLLGGLQGLIGWWMVKSGLVDRADVSQYRLTVHLGMAFLILAGLLWTALDLLPGAASGPVPRVVRRAAAALLIVASLTALSGGLVAGLNAGFAYNDWPLMNGQAFPEEYADIVPFWLNPFENLAAVQFNHRILAYATVIGAGALWFAAVGARLDAARRRPIDLLFGMALLQAGLGIATLMLVAPIPLAVAHQAGAIALFCLSVWSVHRLARTGGVAG